MTPVAPHVRDWVDYLQALLTPTIAIAAAIIGAGQLWIARHKFKLDLFDRRWAVYTTTQKLLADILSHTVATDEEQLAFLRGVRGAAFLFDQRVQHYLMKKLWPNVCTLSAVNALIGNNPAAPGYQDAVTKKWQIMTWVNEQDRVIDELFGPFLIVDEQFTRWIRNGFYQTARWMAKLGCAVYKWGKDRVASWRSR